MNTIAEFVGYGFIAAASTLLLITIWYYILNTVYHQFMLSNDFVRIAASYMREKRRRESGGLLTFEDLQDKHAL